MINRIVLVSLVVCAALFGACGPGASGAKAEPIVGSVPFADGERLTYSIRADLGASGGKGTLSVRRDGANLRLEQRYEEVSPPAGVTPNTDTTTVVAGAGDLRPTSMLREQSGRDQSHRYAADYAADGKTVSVSQDTDKPKSIPVPEIIYDNESSLWLWRTLVLADGYHARYVSLDAVGKTRQTVDLTVTGKQNIIVPAGTFEAWRLQVRNGRATRVAWINVAAPHQIVQWDNGAQVFQLER
ncbi:MAG: DUF3108 domain-containing protein [Chloroflexi bacterium]|nr:MAG: DUF3108 domain-containing protein [Chloroflexota bacterium]